jgi:hypothetical protein
MLGIQELEAVGGEANGGFVVDGLMVWVWGSLMRCAVVEHAYG